MKKVKVIDSMPSTGKTCYMLDHINEMDFDIKVIFITPFLSETERVRDACKKRKFKLPNKISGRGSKQNHLKDLLRRRENIASTHSLFSNIDDETIELIRDGNYMLVLDEVMNVLENFDIYNENQKSSTDKKKPSLKNKEEARYEEQKNLKKDMQTLIMNDFVHIDTYFKATWNNTSKYKDSLHLYDHLKQAMDKDQIYFVSETYLLWIFPPQVFQNTFKEIYILTYQFEAQIQSYYFKFFDIPYEKYGVIKNRKDRRCKWEFSFVKYTDYLEYDCKKRKEMKELITICDSAKLNSIGTKDPDDKSKCELLSMSNYKSMQEDDFKMITTKATSYLSHHLNDRSSTMIWTTFKDFQGKIKSARLPNTDFVAFNVRATNEYREKTSVLYLINRFANPFYKNLFNAKNICFDEDAYGLAEMLQFIFRTAIREDKPIKVFVPSKRMRLLLIAWLDGQN